MPTQEVRKTFEPGPRGHDATMKMSQLEKLFVNSPVHSREVATQAARRLRLLPIQPHQTYLDVGCGNGAAALQIADEYDLDVTAIDIDPKQIRLARQSARGQHRIDFLVGDATRLPFDDARFDLVGTKNDSPHSKLGSGASRNGSGSEAWRILDLF